MYSDNTVCCQCVPNVFLRAHTSIFSVTAFATASDVRSALISLSSGFTTSSCCASAGAYSQKSEPYHIYHTKSLDRGLFPKTLPTLFEKTVPSCIARILVLVTCSLLAALSAASRSIAFSCSIEESSFCRLRRETRDAVKSSWAVSNLFAYPSY